MLTSALLAIINVFVVPPSARYAGHAVQTNATSALQRLPLLEQISSASQCEPGSTIQHWTALTFCKVDPKCRNLDKMWINRQGKLLNPRVRKNVRNIQVIPLCRAKSASVETNGDQVFLLCHWTNRRRILVIVTYTVVTTFIYRECCRDDAQIRCTNQRAKAQRLPIFATNFPV